jgi:hypothetical protein
MPFIFTAEAAEYAEELQRFFYSMRCPQFLLLSFFSAHSAASAVKQWK